jgi:hypothetical protein
MDDLVKETNTGIVGLSVKNVADNLEKVYFNKYDYKPDYERIKNYSRESQAKRLAAYLDEYIK